MKPYYADALGQTAYAAFYTDEARLPWARLDESVREVYRRVGAAVAAAQAAAMLQLDAGGLDELMERWDQTDPAIQRGVAARLAALCNQAQDRAREAEAERDRLRAMVRGLSDRVAAQSELLSRRAEGGA